MIIFVILLAIAATAGLVILIISSFFDRAQQASIEFSLDLMQQAISDLVDAQKSCLTYLRGLDDTLEDLRRFIDEHKEDMIDRD